MAERPDEQLPPDIEPSAESDQTEADSEFVESENTEETNRNVGEMKESVSVIDVAEDHEDSRESPQENVSSELERTESTGSVRVDFLKAESDAVGDQASEEIGE